MMGGIGQNILREIEEDGGYFYNKKPEINELAKYLKKIKIKCVICGHISTGRNIPGGDGTERFPRRHTSGGLKQPCEGNNLTGEWL